MSQLFKVFLLGVLFGAIVNNSHAHHYDLGLLGLHEVRDREELTEILEGVDPVDNSWCAALINANERAIGHKGTGSLVARSFLHYGQEIWTKSQDDRYGQDAASIDLRHGDIVVLWRESEDSWKGHVGYYVWKSDTHIGIFGGNQDNSISIKAFPLDQVLSYRRP